MHRRTALLLLGAACSAAGGSNAQYKTSAGPVRAVAIANGLSHPWALAFLPDQRMLVTERDGRMRIVSPDGTLGAPLAGLPRIDADGQGGLLDVVLDPDFATNRTIWFTFSEPGEGGNGTAVARAKLGEGSLSDVTVVFRQLPKATGGAHFGSRLAFSPDGHLFVTLGERRRAEWSQDLSRHQGKVVRLMRDGSQPPDNPFVGRNDAKPEIWSYGHRNPQGAAIHPETGQLWTVEHGAMGGDEVNIPLAGRNYGWPVITYGRDYSGATIGVGTAKEGMEQPVHYWDPSIAPSGMAFYTGDKYDGWKGSLFVGSLKFGMIARLELDGTKVTREERILEGFDKRVRDIRQGPDGFLYFLTDEDNASLYRLEPVAR
jgi:glucose/arabinose dehydrogenase